MGSQHPERDDEHRDREPEEQQSLTFWQMFTSTLWAVVGVQNRKNRTRDFNKGKAIHFIYFGIGFTLCFVVGMFLLVRFILSVAG